MVMFLFSIVPLAGNTVTVATLLNVKPEKMSLTVFISSLISLFYIPFAVFLYMKLKKGDKIFVSFESSVISAKAKKLLLYKKLSF